MAANLHSIRSGDTGEPLVQRLLKPSPGTTLGIAEAKAQRRALERMSETGRLEKYHSRDQFLRFTQARSLAPISRGCRKVWLASHRGQLGHRTISLMCQATHRDLACSFMLPTPAATRTGNFEPGQGAGFQRHLV